MNPITRRLSGASSSAARGQTTAEYAVLLALVALAVLSGLVVLAGGIDAALERVTGVIT